MKLSARNVLHGTVKSIDIGAVNVEVAIELAPQVCITSIITKKSYEALGLKEGKKASVVIKASDVMVGVED
ncbi:TOBE domain-containing protein [Sulfurospirillum tamanense]|jgi:molybdate transport system regulatory protein|uniref:TOBE domain-containing protein n=1 Tax=Sulfurospirillum tamanense TaxID=2813362 RepID=UPI001F0720F0|nr:TOBE domain-containing protein [Sulfurospirillum tamanensis]